MSKITILHEYPVVLTKDADWLSHNKPQLEPGAIILLPQDAVLVIPPEVIEKRIDISELAIGRGVKKVAAAQKEVE